LAYKLVDLRATLPRHPTRKWAKRKQILRIIVHCTGGTNQDPFETNTYHIGPNHISKKGCPRICYADFIDKDGVVFHCNEYDDWTWHCGAWNKTSVGVVMAYPGGKEAPPQVQYESLLEHLVKLCLFFTLQPKVIYGHREVPGMVILLGNGSKKYKHICPGMAVDLSKLRKEVTLRLQKKLAGDGFYLAKIDGDFGSKSIAALKAWKEEFLKKNGKTL